MKNLKTIGGVVILILFVVFVQSITKLSAQVVITTTATNATCTTSCDGAIDIKISGGVEPYTYAWASTGSTGYKQITFCLTGPAGATNQTATGSCNPPAAITDAAINLCPGTYTVTVTDANGLNTTTIQTIGTQPSKPLAVVTDAATTTCVSSCTGTIKVNASGGNGPYTYAWSSGTGVTGNLNNGLCPGTYSVTVTDKGGCDSILTYNIGPTPTPTITGSPMCSGGTATLTASGGSTYVWSTGPTGPAISVSPVITTTYTVTVNSPGCATSTAAYTLTVNPAVTAVATPINANCNGTATGSITANPGGGTSPYTYVWTDTQTTQTATNLTAGNYTVTITDTKGCTSTSAVTITEPTGITVNSSQTSSACLGSSGSAVAAANGGTGTLTYSWTGYASGQTISGVPAGAYTVIVTDGNGCTKTNVITINDTPKPNVDNLAGTPALCKGNSNGTATVSASGGSGSLTYTWSNGSSGVTGITGLATGIYIITVTDGAGCKAVSSITITEPDAVSSIVSVVNSNCGKPDGSASAIPSGGTGTYTYTWNPAGGTAQTATGLTAGPYTVTVTDVNGCSVVTTATIGTQTPGVAGITSTNIKCNAANSGTAVANISGATAVSYTWAPSGGTGPTASNLAPGPYTVTITDATGCTSTSSTTITEPSPLTAATSSTDAICTAPNGSAVVNNPSGGTVPYVYLWSNSTTNQTATGLTAAGSPYTVIITDANGCKLSTTATIGTIDGSGTATTSQSDVICNGESNGTITANTLGGTSPFTYTWSSAGTGQTESNLPIGSYTVTITDANGCIITSSAIITQPSVIINPTFITTDANCGQSNGSATVSSSGGTGTLTYNWSNLATGATAANLAADFYTVTVTDANGCTNSAVTSISNTGAPIITLAQVDVLCNGGNNGAATVTISGGSSPYTYLWSGGSLAVTTSLTLTASTLTANTYTLTISDANNCQVVSIVTITEPAAISIPAIITSDPKCGQNNGSVIATATGGTSTLTYSWSNSATGATATNLTTGTYTITVTDENGCSKTSAASLTQPAPLTVTPLAHNAMCGSSNGSVIAVITGGSPAYTFSWSNGGSSITNSIIDSLTNLSAGTYSVSITDANGCTTAKTTTVGNVSSAIINVIPAQQTISHGGSVAITVTGGVTYTWSPAVGLSCTNCANPTATPLITTTYTVTATDANGCTVTAMMTVTVKKACEDESDVYVANVFSPNNDGKNDVLFVEGNGLTNIYWAIYDRWGNMLFEAFDQSHGWDGSRKGNPMESGTYVYYLKATCLKTNSEVKLKGNVSIIK